MDFSFEVQVIETEETYPPDLPVTEVPEYLARKKAVAFTDLLEPDQLVITADSVVIYEHKILGKPQNKKTAQDTLRTLSDNLHQVITGVAIMSTDKMTSFSSLSEVQFLPLTEQEISYYVDTYDPSDKAGSYGIQEWIGHIGIDWIKGTYTNIMGLPTADLWKALKSF